MRSFDWLAMLQPVALWLIHLGSRRLKRIERKIDKGRRTDALHGQILDEHHRRLDHLEERRVS